MPYVIYNSTYGVEYGVIGKLKNYLGAEESIALSTVIIERGGSNNIFTASLPDAELLPALSAFENQVEAFAQTLTEREQYSINNLPPAPKP